MSSLLHVDHRPSPSNHARAIAPSVPLNRPFPSLVVWPPFPSVREETPENGPSLLLEENILTSAFEGFHFASTNDAHSRASSRSFVLLACVSCSLDGRRRHGTKGRRAMGRKATQLVVHGASRQRRRWDSCGVVGETRGQARCGSAHEACDVGTACTVPDVRQAGRKSARGGVGDQEKEEEGKVR